MASNEERKVDKLNRHIRKAVSWRNRVLAETELRMRRYIDEIEFLSGDGDAFAPVVPETIDPGTLSAEQLADLLQD